MTKAIKKIMTPSEMGKKSWQARVKKYGKKGARGILKKASHKAKTTRVQTEISNTKNNNHRLKHPDRVTARRLVFSAVRRGELKKGICHCGDEKTQAHHNDYSKPLKVVWLCKKHHKEADKQRIII